MTQQRLKPRSSGPPRPPPWHAALTTVGVTGTNGKTTTTTLIAAALGCRGGPAACITTLGFFVGGRQLRLEGSYQAFLQTLRTCLEEGGRHAAIELSSEALARGFIHAWPCQVGVFTNLTRDHLDAHGSAEHYLASKAQLFAHLPLGGAAILNGCDPARPLLAEIVPPGVHKLYYGAASRGNEQAPVDVRAASIELSWSGTQIAVQTGPRAGAWPEVLRLRAIGHVFAENALAAVLAASAVGVAAEQAAAAIAEVPAPLGRFEVVADRPHVVIDYAHTPDALARTLDTARQLCSGRLTVVFGAGGDRDRAKRPMLGRAAARADRVILTSDNPRSEDPGDIARAIAAGLRSHPEVHVLLDRAAAIESAVAGSSEEDVVVVAGKGHETEQIVGDELRPFSDKQLVESLLS